MHPTGNSKGGNPVAILLESMGNHCLWEFAGKSSFQGFLGGAVGRPRFCFLAIESLRNGHKPFEHPMNMGSPSEHPRHGYLYDHVNPSRTSAEPSGSQSQRLSKCPKGGHVGVALL